MEFSTNDLDILFHTLGRFSQDNPKYIYGSHILDLLKRFEKYAEDTSITGLMPKK